MRAFVLGLLVAALVWWWSGASARDSAAAGGAVPPGAPSTPAAGAAEMASLLPRPAAAPTAAGNQPVASEPLTAGAGTPAPAPAEPPPAAASGAALDELLPRLQRREPAAIAAGWAVAAAGVPADRDRVLPALKPAGDDLVALIEGLGPDNAFLHSAEGRGLADKAVTAAMALPDPQAVVAGTALLERMLRGRIQKQDQQARLFVDETYRQHRIRVDRWLCDPTNVAGARSYTIAKGDSLARIAQRFRKEGLAVEEGTLAVLNRISNPNSIQVGQKIKVPVAPITAVLEKRSFGFAVYSGDQILRLYWVGHGANDRTPVTEFKVGDKQPQPAWTSPEGEVYGYGHPKNILGEYFIKFLHESYTGFGAHGTTLPDTIGTMSSMGCIRMYDADIAELFKILPRGAKVIVRATESLR
ncbi:MAG: L,D-transpeptidase family protein [Planctomycetes bacterium]|jgi:lipoprotein-anchoring transpeptidase ErfK/SrfK|nr:L,D-transpeptidase family protein [Planctomycetota bacterium]